MESEKIIETKNCKKCNCAFNVTDEDLAFYDKVSPLFGGKKYSIPAPTFCPECRQQRRLSFRNERKLYKGICDATSKPIITIYSPDKNYTVYNQEYWLGNDWNALKYGKEFDFNTTFFEQFSDLVKEVPKLSLIAVFNQNSEYVNFAGNNKDCYLIFDSDFCENSMFSNVIKHSKYLVDCSFSMSSEILYQCSDCKESYNLKFCIECTKCSESSFLSNCINCNNCFLCTNLVNKQYHILNKAYSKEEYERKIKDFNLGNHKNLIELEKSFKNLIGNSFVKSTKTVNSENYSGNNIFNSKNVKESFDIGDSEDCKYVDTVYGVKDCYDISSFGEGVEKSYEAETVGINDYHILFSFCVINSSNVYYSTLCWSIKDCFGCVGLNNNQQYCILNKQYTKEEYEILVPKIIEHMMQTGEWGEFFPGLLSSFGYNETVAQEYFPLTKEEAIKKGFTWSDYETPFPKVEKIIPANKLPEDIKNIPDDILNRAIECEVTNKPFRIIKEELDFYRKHNLPIPRKHPDQRHLERMALRNPRKLYDRKCDKCGKDIRTTYAPKEVLLGDALEREEIVYCEDCYNREVY